MFRKGKVYNALKCLCENITSEEIKEGFCGFDAITIGGKAGVSRNNASKELNLLLREKRVIKIRGRPVYYLDRDRVEEILNITLSDDQLALESVSSLVSSNGKLQRTELLKKDIFSRIVGFEGSLKTVTSQAKAAVL